MHGWGGLPLAKSQETTGCDRLLSSVAEKSSPAGASAWMLADGRMHLQHGPIDLLVDAKGDARNVQQAYEQAAVAFDDVLENLVDELPELRSPVGRDCHGLQLTGAVAQRMFDAVTPYRGTFVTPMIAVAGAVADHVLQYAAQGVQLDRLAINNGGDIALKLNEPDTYRVGVVANPLAPRRDAHIVVNHHSGIGGIATSGWQGRSHSLGIADAVTVLAKSAANADVAATVIANAVDVPDAKGICRQAAVELDPDSDLGDLQVTVAVDELAAGEIAFAMRSGVHMAEKIVADGLAMAVYIQLRNKVALVGDSLPLLESIGGTSQDS